MLSQLVTLAIAVIASPSPQRGATPQIAPPQLGSPTRIEAVAVQPAAVDFAPTAVGEFAPTVEVGLRNLTSAPIVLTAARLTGDDASSFEVLGFPPQGLLLRPGRTRSIDVRFAPQGLGLLDARIEFDSASETALAEVELGGHAIGVPGSELRIDVGGGGLTSAAGEDWTADYGTTTGELLTSGDAVEGTEDDGLYQSYREGAGLIYGLPVPPGYYRVSLHFVEPEYTAPGKRSMALWIEDGGPEFIGLDLFAVAGHDVAHVETVDVVVLDGTLDVILGAFAGDAILSGLEVRSFPLLDAEPKAVDFGAVASGETSERLVELTNFGGAPLTIDSLALRLGAGEDASSFSVTLDGVTYTGSDADQSWAVDVGLGSMQSATLSTVFSPTSTDPEWGVVELGGNFGVLEVPLGGLGGHEGHPYLHVVIDAPQVVVDYDGFGLVPTLVDGSTSHTHEPGLQLSGFDWYVEDALASSDPTPVLPLPLGLNSVELEIFDNDDPSDSLRQGVTIEVVPSNAVPGVLVEYYDYAGDDPTNGLSGPLGAAVHVETAGSFAIADTGAVGSSDLVADALVRVRADLTLTAAGNYEFQAIGGTAHSLTLDGAPVGGPLALQAGSHALEARFAVAGLEELPLEVLLAIDGGPATGLDGVVLLHDQSALPPVINAMPSVGTSQGGNDIQILGLGYFPDHSVLVHWGDVDLTDADFTELGPDRIRFDSPPGQGQIEVTVETPNGVSNLRTFTYDDDGPVPINFEQVGEVYVPSRATSGAFGPDGRFYVGQASGQVTAIEYDADYQPLSVTTYPGVSSLPNPEIMGLAFDPYDGVGPVRIYVSHTKLFADGGAAIPPGTFSGYPGQVSVLEGPTFDVPQAVITKLPTSNHDHANFGLVFDHNGDLLVSVGSQTNAGIPHPNSGDLPESPLSAAVVRAHLSDPSFDGALSYLETLSDTINENQVFGETVDLAPDKDVEVFAAGVRNAFGLALHTNGYLYTTDNGPNFGFGPQSTGATSIDADPYSPDELLLLEEGNYYGSPNRNRGRYDARQNVYRHPDGPELAGEYKAPLGVLPSSQNGVQEYRSKTFQGQLRGDLITQKWANTPRRLVLSADGRSFEQELQIFPWTGGLQTLVGPGGVLLSIDYYNQRVIALAPVDLAATGLVVHDITPWRAPASGGTPFVIAGVGFGDLGDTSVTIGGLPATLTAVGPKRIEGLVPAGVAPGAELLDVAVTVGLKQDVLPSAFRYLLGRGLEPGRWDAQASAPFTVGSTAAAAVGGELVVVGEFDTRTGVWDLVTDTWRFAANDRPHPGAMHSAEAVDGLVYLVGGVGAGSEGAVQIFDPVTEQWTLGAPMPWAAGGVSTAVIDGRIYASGGVVGATTVENTAVYDPATDQWTALTPLAQGEGRHSAAAGTDGERLWIFGGRRGGPELGPAFDDVFAYDPVTDTWESSATPGTDLLPLPVARAATGRAVFRFGRFYVIGGNTDTPGAETLDGCFARVDAYDVEDGDWFGEAPMPTPRQGIDPVLFEGRIFVVGGGTSAAPSSSGVVEVFRRL